VVKSAATFKEIKARASNLLGPINVTLQVKRPMSDDFHANVEYFKLGFLDKNSVSLGQQFREILPLLWLKSGAIGRRPEINSDEERKRPSGNIVFRTYGFWKNYNYDCTF
jgi:adenine-specific DNA-methyltransferase